MNSTMSIDAWNALNVYVESLAFISYYGNVPRLMEFYAEGIDSLYNIHEVDRIPSRKLFIFFSDLIGDRL